MNYGAHFCSVNRFPNYVSASNLVGYIDISVYEIICGHENKVYMDFAIGR